MTGWGIILLATASASLQAGHLLTERVETAVSTMLSAFSARDREMLNSVTAPGAVYFMDEEARRTGVSTPLTLDSMASLAGRCGVETIYHLCRTRTAFVVWACPSARTSLDQTYTQVEFDEESRIASVTGDAEPLICVTGSGPENRDRTHG